MILSAIYQRLERRRRLGKPSDDFAGRWRLPDVVNLEISLAFLAHVAGGRARRLRPPSQVHYRLESLLERIVFHGETKDGIGRHSEITIPGRHLLPGAPRDWPETLCPGSLNVRVLAYPADFAWRCGGKDVTALDHGRFVPALEIPRDLITNNHLVPTRSCSRGGDAQVWRATLTVDVSGATTPCWVLRRFASTLTEDLELVSAGHLRTVLDLPRRTRLRVRVDMEVSNREHR